MAGQGPAPKAPDERARANAPARGEWLTLPPLEQPILPELPDAQWSDRTRAMWAAWRADWATQAFGPAEIAMALEAIVYFEHAVLVSLTPAVRAEFRQWVDRLGLNLKGKRDLRLRLEAAKPKDEGKGASEKFGELKLVEDAVSA